MKKHFSFLCIATLIAIMTLVGCPDDGDSNPDAGKIASLQSLIDNASAGDTINLNNYNISNYNATVNKALTINAADKNFGNANVTVTSNGVVLNNVKNSNVTASASLGNGSLKIANSSLSTLTINGGGMNSIILEDMAINTMKIAKNVSENSDQYVRVCILDTTSDKKIDKTIIGSNAFIDYGKSNHANLNDIVGEFSFDENVPEDINVAFRTTIDQTIDTTKVKASFELSENATDTVGKFYIILNKNQTLSKAFVSQVASRTIVPATESDVKIIPQNIYEVGSTNSFDFTTKITTDINFTYYKAEYLPYLIPQYDNSMFMTYIKYVDDATDDNTSDIKKVIEEGLEISSDLFGQVQDKSGNVYYISSGPYQDYSVNMISYAKLYNYLKKEGTDLFSISKTTDTSISPCWARLDVYDNGKDAASIYQISTEYTEEFSGDYCSKLHKYNIEKNEIKKVASSGIVDECDDDINKKISFAQAIAVDKDNNIYIAILNCTFEKNEQNEQIYTITNNGSEIVKYSYNGGILEKDNSYSKTYEDLGIFKNPITFKNNNLDASIPTEILASQRLIGISDMRFVGDELIICAEDKTNTTRFDLELSKDDKKYYASNGQVIIYDIKNNKISKTFEKRSDDEKFYGPTRFAYANDEMFIIFDNGFVFNEDGFFMSVETKSNILKFTKDKSGNWSINKINWNGFPFLYSYSQEH